MSLIDLLFQQQLILISLGMVLLPLSIAVLMITLKAVRSIFAYRRTMAVKRRQHKTERAEQDRATAMVSDLVDEDDVFTDEDDLPVTDAVIHQVKAEDTPEEIAPDEASENKEQSDAPTGAMQDILNSVFVDDEANERFEVLLRDAQDISATDLAMFARRIADELDTRVAS